MNIRSALRSLPSWPVLVFVPVLVLGIGVFNYGPAYRQCTHLAEARAGILAAVADAARSRDRTLRLDRAVNGGDWDRVRIVTDLRGVSPESKVLDCPFGWDLDATKRRAMMRAGRLGLIAFAKGEQLVDYIEFPLDRIGFENVEAVLTRDDAVFTVDAGDASLGQATYVLRPLSSGASGS